MFSLFSFGCKNTSVQPIDVRELRAVTVNLAFRGDKAYDADNVIAAINAKLKADEKPYNVNFSFIGEQNYITDIENRSKEKKLDLAWIYIDDYANLVARETIMNIKPYLEKYGKDLLSGSKKYAWDALNINDKLYAVPRNIPMADFEYYLQVRGDWMNKVGVNGITKVQDYDDYCAAILNNPVLGENYSKIVPNSSHHNNYFLLKEYAPSFYYPLPFHSLYVDINKRNASGSFDVKNMYKSQEYIAWMSKVGEYIDQRFIPSGGSGAISSQDAYFNGGLLGTTFSFPVKQAERIDEFLLNNPSITDSKTNPPLYDVMLNPQDDKYVMQGVDNLMAVMSFSENPNEAVDFLNWVRSDQKNYDLTAYGVEGVNYYGSQKEVTYGDKTRKINYMDFKKVGSPTIDTKKRYSLNMPNWSFADIEFMRWSVNLSDEYVFSRYACEQEDESGKPVNYIINPLVGFSPDLTAPAAKNNWSNVKALIPLATEFSQGMAKLTDTYGNSTSSKYEYLLGQLKSAGIDELINEIQRQIDVYVKANNI